MSVGDSITSDLFALVCPRLLIIRPALPQHDYSANVQGFDENAGAIQRAVRLRRHGDFVAMRRRHEDIADQGE